jgi:hypothetical protein
VRAVASSADREGEGGILAPAAAAAAAASADAADAARVLVA